MITSFAEEVRESHEMDCLEADELLKAIVLANRKPNSAESVFFQRKLGWNEKKINDEIRRMNSVARLQGVCGSPAARRASTTEAATSADILAKEQPRLETKIAELQSKLASLERDARLSEKRVEEQSQAVLQLRELVPQHILQRVQSEVGEIANTLRRDVLDVESRIHELQCCLTPAKYADENSYLEALKRSFRDAVTVIDADRIRVIKLSPAWAVIRREIEVELFDLQAQLPDMRAAHAAALEAAEAPLDYYSSGQPDS